MKKIAVILIVFSSMFLLNACSITGGANYGTGGVSQFNDGYVMAVQTSPDAPHLSVFVDASPWDTGMILGSNTYYAQAPPGAYKFTVARSDDSSSVPLINSVTLNIAANAYYTYFIIDSFKSLQPAVIQDNFLRPSGDSFYVRFLNFCPNSSVLNLIDSNKRQFWASNRTFNDQTAVATNALFGEHPKGTYTLQLAISGTNDTINQKFIFNGSYVYTLYAAGIQGSTDSIKKLSIKSYQNYPQR